MNDMNTRFRLIFRGIRGGMYYCVDKNTGKRASLNTTNPDEAFQPKLASEGWSPGKVLPLRFLGVGQT